MKGKEKPIKLLKKPIKADRESIILDYIKVNGAISNKEARELLGLAESTTKRILKSMVEKELIFVEGEKTLESICYDNYLMELYTDVIIFIEEVEQAIVQEINIKCRL